MTEQSSEPTAEGLTEAEREALAEWLHIYTCYERYAHYDGVNKCETAAGHVESHWLRNLLADRLAAVQAEVGLLDLALPIAEAERDAALAALDRVKALADAAEAREAMSLSRTFDGGSFGAWVDASAIRAAVEGGRS